MNTLAKATIISIFLFYISIAFVQLDLNVIKVITTSQKGSRAFLLMMFGGTLFLIWTLLSEISED